MYLFSNSRICLVTLLASHAAIQLSNSLVPAPATDLWPVFLSHFISNLFPNSKLFLVYGEFFDEESIVRQAWLDKLESVLTQNHIISNSGGITNLKLQRNYSDFRAIPRSPKIVSEVTQIVILLLPLGIPSLEQEAILFRRINEPLLDPSTVRNADKYFIITEKSYMKSVQMCDVIKSIKYKAFLTPDSNEGLNGVNLIQYCPYCPVPEKIFNFPVVHQHIESSFAEHLLSIPEYFPDLQLNYHGHVLRVSSTDKMEGDLEFAKDSNGRVYAKRGVFAAAMYHLAEGLNFTAELYRASAGASTGHTLKNGTWVGSVGDVYSGDASFCMLCGMSYNRHFIVEICSPVTYEYIRFGIGPKVKLYTWIAIFWPFDGNLWVALILATFVTIFCSYIFLKFHNNSKWSIASVSQYFGRIFLEQSEDIPYGLPESIKIIVGFWLLFSMVGTCIYRAKMVTFMTFPVYEDAPDTYDELIETSYEIQFHYFPNIAYNSFKTSTNPVIMEVFQKMLKEPDPVKCLQRTLDTKAVCIMFTSVYDDLLSRNMSDRNGQSPIKSSTQYAFMFTPGISSQKRADFTPNFRRILQISLQMGLNEWWERSDAMVLLRQKNTWIKSLPEGGNRTGVFQYDNGDSDDVLHLRHLKGAFTVFIGGLIFALILFATELSGTLFNRAKAKRERAKKRLKAQINILTFLKSTKNNGVNATGFSKVAGKF